MIIPKIIHQLWKDETIPERYRALSESWRKHHPGWEYRLWTDADIRAFVASEYPSFLSIFDAYNEPVCRADAGRYLILRKLGGVYADLDTECFRPFDGLLDGHLCVMGLEPRSHLKTPEMQGRGVDKLLCPTVIASVPQHPFWNEVWKGLCARQRGSDVLDLTGPLMLTRAHARYAHARQADAAPVTLLPSEIFYPFTKADCWQGRTFDLDFWERATRNAYAAHYWDGSWFREIDDDLQPLPKSFPVVISPGKEQPATAHPSGEPRLISCLMVTRDRFEMARFALECFLRQTYAHRELIVVDDGDDPRLADEIARLADPRIRFVRPAETDASLGTLRNLAIDEARGSYICQWDDDDLSDPRRLEVQMAAIVATGARACFLSSWLIWMPNRKRLLISGQRPWEGSMVCEKAAIGRYPDLRAREDTPVMEALCERHRIAYVDAPRLYVYTHHGRNTWSDGHFEKFWEASRKRYSGARYDAMLRELDKRLPLSEFAASLGDMGPASAAPRIEGVNVFGYLSSRVSFGTISRGLVAAVSAGKRPLAAIDIENFARQGDETIAPYPVNLMVANPDLLNMTFYHAAPPGYDDRLFQGRYNIGYWAWESATTLPDDWQAWFDRFDEIWVPSRYVAHCLAPHSSVPIVDMPVMENLPAPHLSRADLQLPSNPFLFLCIFDELSGFERKNPLGMIEAFHRAFPHDDGTAALIVKARSLPPEKLESLRLAARGRPSIVFRVGEVDAGEIASLIAACDAVLSLHRSEGFGLVLAEAMRLGKPVIATEYSGNLDFMTPETSYLVSCKVTALKAGRDIYAAGTEWAEPDLDHASRLMRALAADPEAARATGRRAAAHIELLFGTGATAARMERRFETIARKGLLARAAARKSTSSATMPPVLILTPVKNASRFLPRYFELLAALDYDPASISLGFIDGGSIDTTYDDIAARLPALHRTCRRVHLMRESDGVDIEGARWLTPAQRLRRATLARARNRLLANALDDEAWVLWLDVDLIDYPSDLLSRLVTAGKDIVVPRCTLPDGRDFDLNSFRFDPARGPAEHPRHLIDGIYQPPVGYGRAYVGDLAGQSPARLDSVGGTALLIRADLHRDGLNFPAYSHRGYIETEGLAMMAADMGYQCWALPELRIVHVSV
ncbi:MAG: glycosyltransferase [Parvibaculum sp.]|uniref:glycosyltransferase n=1 Tax=Parvibaculum sp. TaxID=2024848 RepID=UPI0025D0F374|nr:glycosyltransferase [Parvibaculum sp.]MCE9648478.1 glycosyltransferase [Parvibaculum sp.]